MALELDRLDQHLDGADPEDSSAQTYEFVDQVRLNLLHREELGVVKEAHNDEPLVIFLPHHMQTDIIKGKRHRPRDIHWVFGDELEELLDVWQACLKQRSVVYVDHDLLEVVVLLLPLEQLLRSLVLAKVLEEDKHGQVLEVPLLNNHKYEAE